jgi:tripartite motif-containing protein 71
MYKLMTVAFAVIFLTCVSMVTALPAASASSAVDSAAGSTTAASRGSGVIPGQYIVVLKDSVSNPGRVAERQSENSDADVLDVYHSALKGYAAKLDRSEVKQLAQERIVAYVQPDYMGEVESQTTPTGVSRVFASHNSALDIDEVDDVRVDTNVAVFDTGISASHPDLNVVSQVNCTQGTPPKCAEGGEGIHVHGTHVAGIIGAIDNGLGVVGVAPGVRLWSVKVIDDAGSGTMSKYIAGIDWATATRKDANGSNDIEVGNSSLGFPASETEAPALHAALLASVEAGIVQVVAAGNASLDASKLVTPADDSNVITVSALTDFDGMPGGEGKPSCASGSDDTLASFSNFGSVVDIAAPGVCILSTIPGGGYQTFSGTSMASPHVAGAAAILAGKDKPESKKDVEGIKKTLENEGRLAEERGISNWTDTSGDGVKEPLLYVGGFPLPSASTVPASAIGPYETTLSGSVNPQGVSTTYQFEYGKTTSYGKTIPAGPKSVGSGFESVSVSEKLTGLEAHTTYHFRLKATNADGTTKTEDRTFTTPRDVQPPTLAFAFGSSGTGNGQFTSPRGIAIDSKGNAFIADYSSSTLARIEQFNSKGEYLSQFGSWGTGNGQFKSLGGIAIDSEDNLYLLDVGNRRVEKFNNKGEYLSQFKILQSFEPSGIALSGKGNLWVLDAEEGPLKYTTTGQFLGQASSEGTGDGKYNVPREGIAADADGNIWITDTNNGRIEKFSPKGEFLAKFGALGTGDGQFKAPRGIAIDPKGVLWVADTANSRIEEVFGEGEYVEQFGSLGSGEGQFKSPTYMAADAEGRLWIIDSENKRVEVLKQAAAHKAETTSVSALGRTKATLNAQVNPEGAATSYQFEYGTSQAYGSLAPAAPKSIGSGSTPVKVAETLAGLKPATTYYYRVVATSGETTTYGEDRHFATPALPSDPSAKWRIAGKSLGELGASEASFSVSGSFTIAIPSYGNMLFNCTESGTGKISGAQSLEEKLTLNCTVAGTSCKREFKLGTWTGTLSGGLTPEPKNIIFEGCPFEGLKVTFSLPATIPVDVGTEAVKLPVSASFTGAFGTHPIYYTSVSTWEGASYFGQSFGYESGGPEATSQAATALKPTSATLNGTVNPLGTQSSYFFEYGPTTSYGTTGPAAGASAGAGTEALARSQSISGLVPESTYHFRILATNPKGITYGKDLTFTTAANAAPSYQSSFGALGSENGKLKAPADVAVDASGNTWVIDKSNNRVQKFNSAGAYVSQFGTAGTGNGQFNRPTSIAIGPSGNLWVTDSANNRVQKFNSAGTYVSQFGAAGTENGQFAEPEAIAADAKGNLWVCDTKNGRIEEFSEAGAFIQAVGSKGTGAGQFGKCTGIDIGPSGKVWAADWEGNRVNVFSEAGAFLFSFGSEGTGVGQFKHPDGVEIDSKGNVWVGDEGNNRVQEFTQAGVYFAKFGSAGSEAGKFSLASPIGIATDGVGNLWVTDSANNRVQRWSIPGYAPSYQSSFGVVGSENGKLKAPADVLVDGAGNTWVVDKSNNRVQKFNSAGTYVSQFGTFGAGNGQFNRPTSIAIGEEGELFVTDAGNNRVQRFNLEGKYLGQFGTKGVENGQFEEPESIAVSSSGLLFVCDTKNSRIEEFSETGTFIRVIGSKGTGPGQFGKCTGIDTGSDGRVYAGDWEGNRVNVFDVKGTFLFSIGSEGSGDGQLKHPDAVEVDNKGNIFVGDEGGNRVEQFNPAGEFLTRFGSAGTGAGQFAFALPFGITTDNVGNLWVADPGNNRVQKWAYTP